MPFEFLVQNIYEGLFVLRGLSCDIGRTVGPDASGPLEYE
jgi:hypothetical protein